MIALFGVTRMANIKYKFELFHEPLIYSG